MVRTEIATSSGRVGDGPRTTEVSSRPVMAPDQPQSRAVSGTRRSRRRGAETVFRVVSAGRTYAALAEDAPSRADRCSVQPNGVARPDYGRAAFRPHRSDPPRAPRCADPASRCPPAKRAFLVAATLQTLVAPRCGFTPPTNRHGPTSRFRNVMPFLISNPSTSTVSYFDLCSASFRGQPRRDGLRQRRVDLG